MSDAAANTGWTPPPPAVTPERRDRPTLESVTPADRFRWVRAGAMLMYAIAYVLYVRFIGLPIDRISVAISVGIFLLAAFIGKPVWTWLLLSLDIAFYVAMWWAYENTRGGADRWGGKLQLDWMLRADRWLFFGHDPNVAVQRWLASPTYRWYEAIFSSTYYTHFVVPVIALALLWAFSHRQFARFLRRFATLLTIACAMFVIWPTVPPWMAADRRYPYKVLPPLRRDTWRGFYHLGFRGVVKSWDNARDWGNAVAAMPSLHAGFSLIVVLFFMRWVRNRWLRALMLCFPVLMLFSLVFYAEHWVIDGLAGWAIVGVSFVAWHLIERAVRRARAGRARAAMRRPAAPPAPSIGPSFGAAPVEPSPELPAMTPARVTVDR